MQSVSIPEFWSYFVCGIKAVKISRRNGTWKCRNVVLIAPAHIVISLACNLYPIVIVCFDMVKRRRKTANKQQPKAAKEEVVLFAFVYSIICKSFDTIRLDSERTLLLRRFVRQDFGKKEKMCRNVQPIEHCMDGSLCTYFVKYSEIGNFWNLKIMISIAHSSALRL